MNRKQYEEMLDSAHCVLSVEGFDEDVSTLLVFRVYLSELENKAKILGERVIELETKIQLLEQFIECKKEASAVPVEVGKL